MAFREKNTILRRDATLGESEACAELHKAIARQQGTRKTERPDTFNRKTLASKYSIPPSFVQGKMALSPTRKNMAHCPGKIAPASLSSGGSNNKPCRSRVGMTNKNCYAGASAIMAGVATAEAAKATANRNRFVQNFLCRMHFLNHPP